jgi:hypothetical protein
METSAFLFGMQGKIWKDKSANALLNGDVVVRVVNTRNNVSDSDVVGQEGGSIALDGWFSLTLADMANSEAVKVGDTLIFGLFDGKERKKKIRDLHTHTVTQEDIRLGGIDIEFDLAGGK